MPKCFGKFSSKKNLNNYYDYFVLSIYKRVIKRTIKFASIIKIINIFY